MTTLSQRLSSKTVAVLEMIAAGHTYEQVLAAYPDLSYLDIFAAAREALQAVGQSDASYAERLAKIREKHPRAYEKWSDEEDVRLTALFQSQRPVKEIAATLQRQPGAIRSRLVKLGLEEDSIK
jgi:hypothetical protein